MQGGPVRVRIPELCGTHIYDHPIHPHGPTAQVYRRVCIRETVFHTGDDRVEGAVTDIISDQREYLPVIIDQIAGAVKDVQNTSRMACRDPIPRGRGE
jgi:hypothetical protein